MHRIANLPSEEPNENLALIEQPEAPVLFLTSASSDISGLSNVFKKNQNHYLNKKIRALKLSYLNHNSQVDHYLRTTAKNSKIIIVRFLGSRSDWSYGFEQLILWSKAKENRHIIILSGTTEQEIELNGISNIRYQDSLYLGELLKVGGKINILKFLECISSILKHNNLYNIDKEIEFSTDPYKWDWKNDKGYKIGVIFYSSILKSGDTYFARKILDIFRINGLCPRSIWVSSLKKKKVQENVINIFKKEGIDSIATTTSFASVDFENVNIGNQIWDQLDVPVFQILISNNSRQRWAKSSRGLDPLDLSLQVILPELDGRITTKIGAFKKVEMDNKELCSQVHKLNPELRNIHWISELIKSWIVLQKLPIDKVKIIIILSNYPVKDGRLGNGVGLDTPASLVNILDILYESGYNLGNYKKLKAEKDLIRQIMLARTNSTETKRNDPLDYLPLEKYLKYWKCLPNKARASIETKWGLPSKAIDKELKGFPIHGIKFGNVAILIQPSRGYTEDNIKDIHSPILPPPHRYLAQYFWKKNIFKSNLMIHLGKHGTVEWLPGKSAGQSVNCYPQSLVPPLPYLYPFIVNDPGEGSQAKRRTQSVIIDHLTPPISRASLTKDLLKVETLLDEYYESETIDSKRNLIIKAKLDNLIKNLNLLDIINPSKCIDLDKANNNVYNNLDAYLCELKENQIRTGLHIFGKQPKVNHIIDLSLSIAVCPSFQRVGITQELSRILNISIDPWNDYEGEMIIKSDLDMLSTLTNSCFRVKGDYINWITNQANIIVTYHVLNILESSLPIDYNKDLVPAFKSLLDIESLSDVVNNLRIKIIDPILSSPFNEISTLKKGLQGMRIISGPSGSPTKGKLEVLPTGKNFYSVDIRGLPTESAWDLGRRSTQKILELYMLENGSDLRYMALSVWATSTMRNGGEDISQFLSLIGVKPIWDGNTGKLIDIEVIPISILGRPRVDVTLRISGLFRDAFPHLIELVNKGLKLVGALDEPEEFNPYAFSIKNGYSKGRVYGCSPEGYGTGLQELINLGCWENDDELADCYLNHSNWLYESSEEPIKDTAGLKDALSNVDVVLHNQDNREHDLLDSDDYYQYHGGLTMAVNRLSGKNPKVYFADNSKHSNPKVHKLEKEIDKVVRSRLLNEKWIKGMADHGYKGAFEMSASLDYLFAYDATTNSVPKWCYSSILEAWIKKEDTLNFLLDNNPWALRDISERFLEAYNRGMWNPNDEELDSIRNVLLRSDESIEQGKY